MIGIDEDTIAYEEFKALIQKYGIKTIVETGTWIGNTTEALTTLSDNVYTVEINADSYHKACERLKENKNVKLFNMDSIDFLRQHMQKFERPILFFLDAHYPSTPLLGELNIIAENKIKPIIVIHDFVNPIRPYQNDGYEYSKIEPSLINIYGKNNFKYYYNDQSSRATPVGIIYIVPAEN